MKIREILLSEDPAAPAPNMSTAKPAGLNQIEPFPGSEDFAPGPQPGTPVQGHLHPGEIVRQKK